MAVKGAAAWAHTIPIGAVADKATEVAITARAIDPAANVGKHTEPAIELLIPQPPIELPSCRKVSWRNKCFNAFCHRYHNRFLSLSIIGCMNDCRTSTKHHLPHAKRRSKMRQWRQWRNLRSSTLLQIPQSANNGRILVWPRCLQIPQ